MKTIGSAKAQVHLPQLLDRVAKGETILIIGNLPITTDPQTESRAWAEIVNLARTYELTSYDAAYLELAVRLGFPLATQDDSLKKTPGSAGVLEYSP